MKGNFSNFRIFPQHFLEKILIKRVKGKSLKREFLYFSLFSVTLLLHRGVERKNFSAKLPLWDLHLLQNSVSPSVEGKGEEESGDSVPSIKSGSGNTPPI